MPDVYSMITEVEPAVVEQLATAMEVSAADPQHREMVDAYLAELDPRGIHGLWRSGAERVPSPE